tara:strand:- start:317 stop:637 length:321 start_codon:yes stop_codon:yes gene_type:complete
MHSEAGPTEVEVTYATKGILRALNLQARDNGWDHWELRSVEALPEAWYPVCKYNEDTIAQCVMVTFMVDTSGQTAVLPLSHDEFAHLPTAMHPVADSWFDDSHAVH